jgi:hypothetical protein
MDEINRIKEQEEEQERFKKINKKWEEQMNHFDNQN